jgi:hypothetical protein
LARHQRSWLADLQGANLNHGLRYSFGIALGMGDWER